MHAAPPSRQTQRAATAAGLGGVVKVCWLWFEWHGRLSPKPLPALAVAGLPGLAVLLACYYGCIAFLGTC